jgi:2-polyprenyl-6-methoxyphenol hydroxylase-like FAD-dependent oxidoreductase
MAEQFDVIVVGARCAGSPLAAMLARKGLRVVVVERATFPRDTLSTHVFQAEAIAFLDRLGVTDQLRATGAPFINRVDSRQEDVQAYLDWPRREGDPGGAISIRRFVLDPILAQAAVDAGADVRMGTNVTELIEDHGRVTGVRAAQGGSTRELEARLVVGADGRNSTIARLVKARKYNLTPGQRFAYWAFFEGANLEPDPPFVFHRWADRLVVSTPADSGLYLVVVIPDLKDLPRFREDLEGSYMDYACSCEPVAKALSGGRRVGKLFGILRWEGFFREPSGPGWVLAGDAGHFKDPTPGQGIQDAFRQVDALAPLIVEHIGQSDEALDNALAKWGRWRDKDAAEHYWFAADLGKAGAMPTAFPELVRRLVAQHKTDAFLDVLNHRKRPSKVLTPPRLLGATSRLLIRPGCDRRGLLRELRELVAEDAHRKRLNRHPVYVAADASPDAGQTEVQDRPEVPVP